VIWGLFHGTFLVIERLVSRSSRRLGSSGPGDIPSRRPGLLGSRGDGGRTVTRSVLLHSYTLLVVMIGWVFFRADTLPGAIAYLKAMAGLGLAMPTTFAVQWYLTPELRLALAAGVIGSMPWLPALAREREQSWTFGLVSTAALVALLAASVMQMAARTYNPFIYFRF
jgi:alginate O-acetyltransferase complex protein AlgI